MVENCLKENTWADQSDGALKVKHVEDTVELCGVKLGSKGAPTPITKATVRGRRYIDDTVNEIDAQTFRQAAGTGLYMSIDRPSACDVRGDEWNE